MNQEWAWAAAIIAIPVLGFAALELAQWLRRRRYQAIARRSKSARPSGSRSGRTH